MKRDDVFYYVRHNPIDLCERYRDKKLWFSLKTKSLTFAIHVAKLISQRLKDYWFGIRFKRMDVHAKGSVHLDQEKLVDSLTIGDLM